MRLLEFDDGQFRLVEKIGREIPRYAILSHRWGADEVTYQDIMAKTGEHKAGYEKLQFCAQQAANDGIGYVWIDSCCINKTDAVELSEAIISMFRWYQSAERCYVYLPHIPAPDDDWQADFRKSDWFNRGWTLQELLAPASVEFFSRDGKRLGDKRSLERQIHEITGIATQALRGEQLSSFSISDRMQWMERRETTREEDKAYSLMGIFDVSMPVLYGEGEAKALSRLRKEIDHSLQQRTICDDEIADATPFIVPFERNPEFTGREAQLAKLEEYLRAASREWTTKVAITGLGGVGKTQVALELAYRSKTKHTNRIIIWIPSTDMESLKQAYNRVAQQLDIPGWDNNKLDTKKLVQDYLSDKGRDPWLLIFDNADDFDMWVDTSQTGQGVCLMDFLPRHTQSCIIFTTRDRKTASKLARKNVVEIPNMEEQSSLELLKRHLPSTYLLNGLEDAKAVLQELTHLPLAIVQAAAYISQNGITLQEYLSLLNEQEAEVVELLSEDFEDEWRYRNVKNPVATTWLISFERIRSQDPQAAEYLSLMASIEPKDIPLSFLPRGPSRKRELDAIGTLDAYSFIYKRPGDMALDLHRLVHLATRSWLRTQHSLAFWSSRTINRLQAVIPWPKHKNGTEWRRYLPHARFALKNAEPEPKSEGAFGLLHIHGRSLLLDGRFKEAETIIDQAIEATKMIPNISPDISLSLLNDLSIIYMLQGRLKDAEELHLKTVEAAKIQCGAENKNTLICLAHLATLHREYERLEEAEKLDLSIIDIGKKNFGLNHALIINSMGNLASTYSRQGRLTDAEELLSRVIVLSIEECGVENPDTLTSLSVLAGVYKRQGRLDEAEILYAFVKDTRVKVQDVEHRDSISEMINLASVFWSQRRYEEAEGLYLEAMGVSVRVLGDDHPETVVCKYNLATTYMKQGRWKEAEELLVDVLDSRERMFRGELPSTFVWMECLAEIYIEQGRRKEAEELTALVLEKRRKVLGEEHEKTLNTMDTLSLIWRDQGRLGEAEEQEVRVIEISKRVLGEGHPKTLTRMKGHWCTLMLGGKFGEAIELFGRISELHQKIVGFERPRTPKLYSILNPANSSFSFILT